MAVNLSPLQLQILKALESLGAKSKFPETVLAKKIRENIKLTSKNKAVIALTDLESVLAYLAESGTAFYSLTLNSANDLLIEKSAETKMLSAEARQRRVKSEKSMTILTNKDVK